MGESCCELVLKSVPLASSLIFYEEDKNLISYQDNSVFIIKLRTDLGDSPVTPSHCDYQKLNIQSNVLSVFKWSEKYWISDGDGVLHQMGHNSVNADSADLFDDTTAEDGMTTVKKVFRLPHSDVVSATLAAPDALAVVSYRNDKKELFVALHHLETPETVAQSIVLSQNVLRKPNDLFMEFVDSNDIEREFVSNWFPHFNQTQKPRGFLFVYNCNEKTCCVQLGFESLSIGFFFSWPSPCVFSTFRPSSMKDGEFEKSKLILSFSDGAVIEFSRSGGNILNFTIDRSKCVSFVDGFLLSSDYTDCQVTPLDPAKPCCLLPVKGVISFCVFNAQKAQVLALTNHGGLYLLRANNLSRGKCQIPTVSSFQETLNHISYLEELNSRIEAQDSSIKCLATVLNAKNLRFQLDVQVVQIMADDHLFRITCELLAVDNCPSPVLRARDWHVIFVLSSSKRDSTVHIQQLPRDFSKSQSLEVMVRLKLECYDSRDYVVAVKLISFKGEGKYRPMLPLGKVRLNVLSFLEPEQSLLAHSASSSVKPPSIVELLRSQATEVTTPKEPKDLRLVLEVPTNSMEARHLIQKLMEKSKALWRTKQWEHNVSDTNTRLCAAVHNDLVTVEIRNNKATVSCQNPCWAILVGDAITDIVAGHRLEGFNESILMEAENILQSLEILEASQEESCCSEVFDIFKRKVKFVNESLLGISTIFE